MTRQLTLSDAAWSAEHARAVERVKEAPHGYKSGRLMRLKDRVVAKLREEIERKDER